MTGIPWNRVFCFIFFRFWLFFLFIFLCVDFFYSMFHVLALFILMLFGIILALFGLFCFWLYRWFFSFLFVNLIAIDMLFSSFVSLYPLVTVAPHPRFDLGHRGVSKSCNWCVRRLEACEIKLLNEKQTSKIWRNGQCWAGSSLLKLEGGVRFLLRLVSPGDPI